MQRNILRLFILPIIGLTLFSGLVGMEALKTGDQIKLKVNGQVLKEGDLGALGTNCSGNEVVFSLTKKEGVDNIFSLKAGGRFLKYTYNEKEQTYWVHLGEESVKDWVIDGTSRKLYVFDGPFGTASIQVMDKSSKLVHENDASTFDIEIVRPPSPPHTPHEAGAKLAQLTGSLETLKGNLTTLSQKLNTLKHPE